MHSILARGDKVIATGSRLGKLKHLEEVGVAILQLDITDSQPSILDTIANAISIYGKIVVLINNASYIQIGTWEDLEYVVSGVLVKLTSHNMIGTKTFSHNLIPMYLAQLRLLGHFCRIFGSDEQGRWYLSARSQAGLATRVAARMLVQNLLLKVR